MPFAKITRIRCRSAKFAFDFLLMDCDHPELACNAFAQLLVLSHVGAGLERSSARTRRSRVKCPTPSPGPPRLVKTPAAGHPLPQGGEGLNHDGGRGLRPQLERGPTAPEVGGPNPKSKIQNLKFPSPQPLIPSPYPVLFIPKAIPPTVICKRWRIWGCVSGARRHFSRKRVWRKLRGST